MKEELITFETAKLAKEKCFYLNTNNFYSENDEDQNNLLDGRTSTGYYAPTQSLLQRWLREEYNINCFIGFKPNIKKWDCHSYSMNLTAKEYIKERGYFPKDIRHDRY